jgi:hypothetical protein
VGGLLVWMAAFVAVYVFAALACARGFADVSWAGLPIVTLMTLLASLLAGAATIAIVRRGYRLQKEATTDEPSRFIGFVALASGGIALIALMLLVLPALFADIQCLTVRLHSQPFGPTVSAENAPRSPSGFTGPTVVSFTVCRSSSELISAPRITT